MAQSVLKDCGNLPNKVVTFLNNVPEVCRDYFEYNLRRDYDWRYFLAAVKSDQIFDGEWVFHKSRCDNENRQHIKFEGTEMVSSAPKYVKGLRGKMKGGSADGLKYYLPVGSIPAAKIFYFQKKNYSASHANSLAKFFRRTDDFIFGFCSFSNLRFSYGR
jgi:hypothetical protein